MVQYGEIREDLFKLIDRLGSEIRNQAGRDLRYSQRIAGM